MSETVTKRISDAPDAGLFDPSWRIPIAVQGSDGAFSTSAAEFLNATKKGTFDRVDTSVLNVTDVMTGNGVANYMASPPPIGTGVPNLGRSKRCGYAAPMCSTARPIPRRRRLCPCR